MIFASYYNINEKVKKLGGVKKTVFNKNLLEEAEKSWEQFSPAELSQIDAEFPTAPQVYSSIITSKAICIYEMHTFTAVPVKDVLWIYGSIMTQKMNFIPYNKEHSLALLARNGRSYTLGRVNTGGFSKKKPNDEKIEQLRNFLYPYRKGIVYGYSEEMYKLFTMDFGKAIEMVDANSREPAEDSNQ